MSETFNDKPKQRRVLAPTRPLSGNVRRYALQQRHFAEQEEFNQEQDRRRIEHFERLQVVYDTSVYRDELRPLERKRFPMPWHKARMAKLRQTIEAAETQHQQARETFTNAQEQERETLMDRQAQERQELEKEIAALPDEVRRSPIERETLRRLEEAVERRRCPHCNPPRLRLRLICD
jgi:hypothetical protein